MRYFLFIIFVVSMMGSGCSKDPQNTLYQRDPRWVLADEIYDNEIARKFFWQLKKEKKLQVCESGWALRGKDRIQIMHCGFHYYGEMNIEEARKLLVKAGEMYLNEINKNERIRPLLFNYPFKPENIQIEIFLFNPDGSLPSPEKLHVISLIGGLLEYTIGARDSQGFRITTKETFEEVAAKLNNT